MSPAPCYVLCYCQEKSDFVISVTSLHVVIGCYSIPLYPLLCQTKVQVPQFSLLAHVLCVPGHLDRYFIDLLQVLTCLFKYMWAPISEHSRPAASHTPSSRLSKE